MHDRQCCDNRVSDSVLGNEIQVDCTERRLPEFGLCGFQLRVLGGVLVVRVERVAAGDEAVARGGGAVAEGAAERLRLSGRPASVSAGSSG